MKRFVILFLAVACMLPAAAFAQLTTMSRQDGGTFANIQFDFTIDNEISETLLMRTDIYAQFEVLGP